MIRISICKTIQSKYFVPFCFVIAILLRCMWILLIKTNPVSDSSWYYEKGLDIASGKGYTIEGIPTAYYPVGYPVFLAIIFKLFGDNLFIAKIANIILYAGILYFGYFISKKIFSTENTLSPENETNVTSNSEFIGRITLFTLAIYPNNIAYSSVLATESLFLFLFLGGTCLFIISKGRFWHLFISGIIWGMMCLVRPQGFFIPLIIVLTLIVSNKRTLLFKLKILLVVYTFLIIAMLPWLIRNYYVFHDYFIISTNDGINLLIGNNPYSTGEYLLDDKVIAYCWDRDNLYASPDSLVKNLSNSKYWTSFGFKNENIANKKLRSKALDYVIHNPLEVIKLLPKKLWFNYKRGSGGIGWNLAEYSASSNFKQSCMNIFKKITNFFYYLVIIFSIAYIFRCLYKIYIKKQKLRFPTTGLWLVLYFSLLVLIYFGSYRFHLPLVPWIVMYFAAFIESTLNAKKIG